MKAIIALPPPDPARLHAALDVLVQLLVDQAIAAIHHHGGDYASSVVQPSRDQTHDGHQDPE